MISLSRAVLSTIVATMFLISGVAVGAAATLPPVDPAACTVEPILPPPIGPEGDLDQPSPTPTAIIVDATTAADAETADAVIGRIAQAIACRNAGDPLRMLANFTETWVQERIQGYDLVFYQRFMFAAMEPLPLPEEEWITLIAVEEVRLREDGAALATVRTEWRGEVRDSLLVLVESDGIWRIAGGELAAPG